MAEDRRTRRTKRLLRNAMVELVLQNGFDNVTVEDITEHADISRATFYKYYSDKQALLNQIVSDVHAELQARLVPLAPESSRGFTGKPALELFRHAREERDAYRVILRGEGHGTALRTFIDIRTASAARIFAERAANLGVTMRIQPELLARAWVGEQVAILQWWLEQDEPTMTAEEITQMLLTLSLRGRYWANGFDGPPDDVTLGPAPE
ncbi:TetR/AcrR family transcriptional regulator [Prauserella sp. PE36]|uniref:TetR/AcrR family transcriptional regulator n=2 Tax=Prauserella TaxID=142577 RepID=A0ABY2SAT3_9PSEU|nr:TetR/AcrR family transcriptional regulator [Prauserella endophytica]PXY29113.1 TetR family transcriptional regulator [Prauserella coralliicola]RBM14671.1 TetR/AcrR family transcriptional regulator [Prauserella sp. PE36]TKG72801.1 TetR/AcrR family transcriptional regulator [Prauserella endophytica]